MTARQPTAEDLVLTEDDLEKLKLISFEYDDFARNVERDIEFDGFRPESTLKALALLGKGRDFKREMTMFALFYINRGTSWEKALRSMRMSATRTTYSILFGQYKIYRGRPRTQNDITLGRLISCFPLPVAQLLDAGAGRVVSPVSLDICPRALQFPGGGSLIPKNQQVRSALEPGWRQWSVGFSELIKARTRPGTVDYNQIVMDSEYISDSIREMACKKIKGIAAFLQKRGITPQVYEQAQKDFPDGFIQDESTKAVLDKMQAATPLPESLPVEVSHGRRRQRDYDSDDDDDGFAARRPRYGSRYFETPLDDLGLIGGVRPITLDREGYLHSGLPEHVPLVTETGSHEFITDASGVPRIVLSDGRTAPLSQENWDEFYTLFPSLRPPGTSTAPSYGSSALHGQTQFQAPALPILPRPRQPPGTLPAKTTTMKRKGKATDPPPRKQSKRIAEKDPKTGVLDAPGGSQETVHTEESETEMEEHHEEPKE